MIRIAGDPDTVNNGDLMEAPHSQVSVCPFTIGFKWAANGSAYNDAGPPLLTTDTTTYPYAMTVNVAKIATQVVYWKVTDWDNNVI